jgi:16S rRNA (adenine1518-N6/adenine1519-N6)-dimethyltransferase
MSESLSALPISLLLFEIDRSFAAYLRRIFHESGNVEVIEGDFLSTWRRLRKERGEPFGILGNLPYNAASQIIAVLLEGGIKAERMVFTVQREVAMRMNAEPGSTDYSSFTVLCGLHCSVEDAGDIAAGSFYPAPKVVSRTVVLRPHRRYGENERQIAGALARDAFSSRRKTVKNTLKAGETAAQFGYQCIAAAMKEAGIDPGLRGERLSVGDYVKLAECIKR